VKKGTGSIDEIKIGLRGAYELKFVVNHLQEMPLPVSTVRLIKGSEWWNRESTIR
jgi:hypothetical protein